MGGSGVIVGTSDSQSTGLVQIVLLLFGYFVCSFGNLFHLK